MPDFDIDGNPAGIRSRAATMRTKADSFLTVADGLSRISADGWTGRAAQRFWEKFDAEPGRWREAGDGFITAAGGLETYAAELDNAKAAAKEAEAAYEAANAATRRAESDYKDKLAHAVNVVLDVAPFVDPGEGPRLDAIRRMESIRADLDNAAHLCAGRVRAGCAAAPEKRNWLESGLAFVGGIAAGAGEALWDLAELGWNLSITGQIVGLVNDLNSGMTTEEIAAKHQMRGETVLALGQALKDDPVGFGKNLGAALIDLDTWKDDPARAIGHLVPDAIAAVASGGTAAAATRGATALGMLGRHADDLIDGAIDTERALDGFEDLRHLDELDSPPSNMFEYDGRSPRSIDDQLTNPSYSPDNRSIIDSDYDVLGGRDRATFEAEFLKRNPADADYPYDWNWPPHDGKVPGSETYPQPGEVPRLDRVGGDGGTYFGEQGAPMSTRALPPDRLNFNRSEWQVHVHHPDLDSGAIRIERSDIAGWFGQDGGGQQYRFVDTDGNALSQGALRELGVIREPTDGWDWRTAATGAVTTQGLQGLNDFIEEGSRTKWPN